MNENTLMREELNNLRYELRQLDTDLNSIFRTVNDGKVVETVRYLDGAKKRVDGILDKIGWYV